ncbi:Peptidase C15 [Cordyceps militaris CM01]|uniref:Peptidase C15 n=1 Tax=Cordyceps militaris (strain CM01) TaxID=983644 RepID=G3JK29_CORMM|nr:Peptidase C15 [Cordyceps militaris CM01]EGX92159.1 Peptidase C15 [Cordyceps militaris CM01]
MSSSTTVKVAVTGNAPFLEYDFNTSRTVRDALPDSLQTASGRTVQILKYHRDTRDTYADVRQVSRDIWGGDPSFYHPPPPSSSAVSIDFIVHLGMIALGWDDAQFRFETLARRAGYALPGDDGQLVDAAELERLGLPAELHTALNVEAGCRQVKACFPDTVACVSEDAGLYFCEFRLYSSLAEPLLHEAWAAKRGKATFVHLPQAHDEQSIFLARDIVCTFIKGLVDG